MLHDLIALVALTAMEIVLGIDNIVFISVVSSRLPVHQQPLARRVGLLAAMGTRIVLLLAISLIVKADDPFFNLTSIPLPEVLNAWLAEHKAINGISVRDLIVLGGGLFLIWSSVREIHHKVEGEHEEHSTPEAVTFRGVISQIAVLDIVFSLDSVITAVGMAESIWVMITAVVLAVGVMMLFAGPVSAFVEKHPTVKMLALSFLLLIGVMLVADGLGTHIDKGYIYFAMAFALLVEMLNLRMKSKARQRRQKAAH
ncbi:MAG TPA: TerC family protein [Pirellulaceae bacterium]|nr:TerC family protein [Pirellulaceae bacterium]